jgi:phage recombination protein Bet
MQSLQNQSNNFSEDQIKLIKSQVSPKATTDELALFLYVAKRSGLDPLTRQVYAIHRNVKNSSGNYEPKMTIQTSIDGFRVIAQRSGDYAGQSEPEFVMDGNKIVSAKIKVYKFRGNERYAVAVGIAYWNEYVPNPGQDAMWKKMPHTMIAKVAEAIALRKAFPQDLSALYTVDEMQAPEPELPPTEDQKEEFLLLLEELVGIKGDEANRYHPDFWKQRKTAHNYTLAINHLKELISTLTVQP